MRTYDEAQDYGAQKFGFLWLQANQVVTDVAHACGIDYTKEPYKGLLVNIALGVLEKLVPDIMIASLTTTKNTVWKMWELIWVALERRKRSPKDDLDGAPEAALSAWKAIDARILKWEELKNGKRTK